MLKINGVKNIEVVAFDTSNEQQRYLAIYGDRNFEINSAVAELVLVLQKASTLSEACEIYTGPQNRKYSMEEMEKIIEKCIVPILESLKAPKPQSLIFSMELIPQSTIKIFSVFFKFLFKTPIVVSCILLFIAFEVLFLIYSRELFGIGHFNIYLFLGIFGLVVLSSLIHEIGHASACRFFNVEHGGVGFGLYLNFPVFYTDVSGIWRLPQKQRIIVNFAGIYFQLLLLIPLFVLYFLTFDNVLKFFILTINLNLIITLNPFFKYDGYWIVSDLLGVANLRYRSKELISYLFKKLTKRPITGKPYLLLLKKREKRWMIAYTVVVNLFFAFYFFYIIPVFLYDFFNTFPGLVEKLVTVLSNGESPNFTLLQQIISQFLFFVLITFVLIRMLIIPLLRSFTPPKKER